MVGRREEGRGWKEGKKVGDLSQGVQILSYAKEASPRELLYSIVPAVYNTALYA